VTKFAFVSSERGNHAVATLCRLIGASVSGFYAWLHAIRRSIVIISRSGGDCPVYLGRSLSRLHKKQREGRRR
jgi:hypothetical protein